MQLDFLVEYGSGQGKIIVITEASSGIGRQAALDFVNEGAGSIILIARSESKLLELKRTLQVINEPERAFRCDISKKEDVLRMGTQILEKFGHIDLLINKSVVDRNIQYIQDSPNAFLQVAILS